MNDEADQVSVATEFRRAWPDEIGRAMLLLGRPGAQVETSSIFVAVHARPVERLLAVAWCQDLEQQPDVVAVDWVVIAAERHGDLPRRFLGALVADRRSLGARRIRSRSMVIEGSWQARAYQAAGFRAVLRNLLYETPIESWAYRNRRFLDRASRRWGELPPSGFALEALDGSNAAVAWPLVRGHGLIAPGQFSEGLRVGRYLDHSWVLRGAAQRVVGVLVATSESQVMTIDAFVVEPAAGVPTGVVGALLMQAAIDSIEPLGVAVVRYRFHPEHNPATGRTGLRFGGKPCGAICSFELQA